MPVHRTIENISADMQSVLDVLNSHNYNTRQRELLLMFIVGASLGISQTPLNPPPKELLNSMLAGWRYAVENADILERFH